MVERLGNGQQNHERGFDSPFDFLWRILDKSIGKLRFLFLLIFHEAEISLPQKHLTSGSLCHANRGHFDCYMQIREWTMLPISPARFTIIYQ